MACPSSKVTFFKGQLQRAHSRLLHSPIKTLAVDRYLFFFPQYPSHPHANKPSFSSSSHGPQEDHNAEEAEGSTPFDIQEGPKGGFACCFTAGVASAYPFGVPFGGGGLDQIQGGVVNGYPDAFSVPGNCYGVVYGQDYSTAGTRGGSEDLSGGQGPCQDRNFSAGGSRYPAPKESCRQEAFSDGGQEISTWRFRVCGIASCRQAYAKRPSAPSLQGEEAQG